MEYEVEGMNELQEVRTLDIVAAEIRSPMPSATNRYSTDETTSMMKEPWSGTP